MRTCNSEQLCSECHCFSHVCTCLNYFVSLQSCANNCDRSASLTGTLVEESKIDLTRRGKNPASIISISTVKQESRIIFEFSYFGPRIKNPINQNMFSSKNQDYFNLTSWYQATIKFWKSRINKWQIENWESMLFLDCLNTGTYVSRNTIRTFC